MSATVTKSNLEIITDTVKVISIVAGVVLSILSFTSAQRAEAEARRAEAVRPFLELRQKDYADALHVAAVLSNPKDHTTEEIQAAKKRFAELYVAELSMVETPEVESDMVQFAAQVDPDLLNFTPAQTNAYNLAHALEESYTIYVGGK